MYKLGFIGAGNMATALINGIISSDLYAANAIAVSDPFLTKLEELKKEYGVNTFTDNNKLVNECDVILLAIKPQHAEHVLTSLRIINNPLFISILSGITTETIAKFLPSETRIIRAMPNTPAIIHKGSTVITAGKHATEHDIQQAIEIFKSVGSAEIIEEKYIDAVAAISGSGPAYFYMILEAMSDAGVRAGLSRDLALKLAAETAAGSAHMILETKTHPAILKDMVASPAGTTIEALHEFEKGALRSVIMNGIQAATIKAKDHNK